MWRGGLLLVEVEGAELLDGDCINPRDDRGRGERGAHPGRRRPPHQSIYAVEFINSINQNLGSWYPALYPTVEAVSCTSRAAIAGFLTQAKFRLFFVSPARIPTLSAHVISDCRPLRMIDIETGVSDANQTRADGEPDEMRVVLRSDLALDGVMMVPDCFLTEVEQLRNRTARHP
jgi:hypothetical protein